MDCWVLDLYRAFYTAPIVQVLVHYNDNPLTTIIFPCIFLFAAKIIPFLFFPAFVHVTLSVRYNSFERPYKWPRRIFHLRTVLPLVGMEATALEVRASHKRIVLSLEALITWSVCFGCQHS